MTNTTLEKNFIYNSFINNTPKVVILEDMELIRQEIQQFIENELGWQVIIAENRSQAIRICESQGAEFYILDIKLGTEKDKSQAGIDTAEEIRQIDKNVFISIFSGIPDLEPHKKMAEKIGVNYFEEKGGFVREGVARIAVEMLRFQRKLLNDILREYLHSSTYLGDDEILKIVNKIKEVNKKLEDIQKKLEDIQIQQKLEKSYQSNSVPRLSDEPELDPELDEDKNIQKYESLKQISTWREKYQGRYVAFADGQQIEGISLDDSKELETFLDKLRKSEHNGKSIFYKKVPKNNIVDTQGSDKFIEEEEFSDKFIEGEEFMEAPMSFYDFYPSEDEN